MKLQFVLLFVLGLLSPLSILAQTVPLVFTHVNVIDMTGQPLKSDQTVVIENNLITSIGAWNAIRIPAHAKVVDATGKFLIPGLWDAHAHLAKAGVTSLALFIANGITSVRDMGGDPGPVLGWRKQIEEGKQVGPRIKTAGPILETMQHVRQMKREATVEPVERTRVGISSPSDVEPMVDSVAKLGVDFLKIRSVASLETYQAIGQAAQKHKLALTGHAVTSIQEMIQAKQKSIEHSFFPPLDSVSEIDRKVLFGKLAKQEIYLVPTLINWEGSLLISNDRAMAIVEDKKGKLDFRRKYLSGYLIEDWREQIKERKNYPFDASKLFSSYIRDVKGMHQAGVQLLAGTDVALALIYPGFSLHEELQLLVEQVGMSPMQALLCATEYPAAFFGMQDHLGTIEQGKIADLLLLEANPLDQISNTTKINAVVVNGKYYPKKELAKLLTNVEKAIR